jgi:hypothetical protein
MKCEGSLVGDGIIRNLQKKPKLLKERGKRRGRREEEGKERKKECSIATMGRVQEYAGHISNCKNHINVYFTDKSILLIIGKSIKYTSHSGGFM